MIPYMLAVAITLLPLCVPVSATVSLTTADHEHIVKLHNDARDNEPASDMIKMTFDATLASEAQSWTDGCDFKHQKGKSWGENLSAVRYHSSKPMSEALDRLFGLWMKEKQFNTGGTFEECCSQTSWKCCHYTQVIWAKSIKIGCGLTECPTLKASFGDMSNMLYLACYYSPPGNRPAIVYTYDWKPYLPVDTDK